MKRPLVYMLIFLICGILNGYYLYDYALYGAVIVSIISGVIFFTTKAKPVLALPVFMLAGIALVSLNLYNPEIVTDESSEITGTVKEISRTDQGKTKAIVLVDRINGTRINITIVCYADELYDLKDGERISIIGELLELDRKRNPGGFDEFLYMKTRGVSYKVYTEEIKQTDKIDFLAAVIPNIRSKLTATFDRYLPAPTSGIMKAMIIGDNTGLTDETKETYKEAGIYHILAISGLHVTIISMVLGSFLSVFMSERKSAGLTLIFLFFYCICTGFGVSTQRAVIMCGIMFGSKLLNKKYDIIQSVVLAAIIVLVMNPLYLWDIGFLYSFSTIIGIAFGNDVFELLFVRVKTRYPVTERFFRYKLISKYLSVTLSAFIVNTPITMYVFGYIYPYSVLINLILVPTSFVPLLCGIAICVFGLFGVPVAGFLSISIVVILEAYDGISKLFAVLPFSKILSGSPDLYIIALYYLFFALIVYTMSKSNIKSGNYIKWVRGTMICSALILTINIVYYIYPEDYEIVMLDVGQGDCTVITKNDLCIVIDGGGSFSKSEGKNTGKMTLIPYLEHRGIHAVDAVFLSHFDIDHGFGVLELIKYYEVEQLFIGESNEDFSENDLYSKIMSAAKSGGTEITAISKGDRITFGETAFMECLLPETDSVRTDNDNSLILKLVIGGFDFMFTGDAGFAAEKVLMNLYTESELDIDILKIGHHGSKYSTGKDFLEALSPVAATIGVGRNNAYNHPSPDLIDRLESKDIPYFATSENGAIILRTNGNELRVESMISTPR